MNALILAATLAAVTQQQAYGLSKALKDAVQSVPGSGTVISAPKTLIRFGSTVTAAGFCIRCTIKLDESDRLYLGLPAGTITEPADTYAAMQVCSETTSATKIAMPSWFTDLIDTCSASVIPATAGWYQVTVALRQDPVAKSAVTGFACACAPYPATSSCQYRPRDANGVLGALITAPTNTTFQNGEWSGASCIPKNCIESLGTRSMPLACMSPADLAPVVSPIDWSAVSAVDRAPSTVIAQGPP